MATDESRLLVHIEAKLDKFEKGLAKATGTTNRAARQIETRFRTVERNLSVAGRGMARSILAPLAAFASAREIGQATDAFTRIQNSLRVAGLEGEAAARVFDRLFEAAQKNAAPIESLTELYSRAALVQKELGVSTEELLRFTEGVAAALRVSGRSAQESSGALLQLSQALGSGVVRAEEFNSLLEGALPIAQAAARGLAEAGGSVAKLRQLVIDGKVSSEAFFRAFEAGQGSLESLAETTEFTLGGALTRVQNSFIKLIGGMNETTGTARALGAGLEGVADVIESIGVAVDFLADKWDRLRDAADPEMWERFRRLMFDLDLGLSKVGETADSVGPAVAELRKIFPEVPSAGQPAVTPVSLGDFASPDAKGAKKKTPEQTFAEDIARIRERIGLLHQETVSLEDSRYEQERALAVMNLINEAKRAGVALDPARIDLINQEAAAYAGAVVEFERAAQLQEDIRQIQEDFVDMGLSSMQGLIDGTSSWNDVLQDTLGLLQEIAAQFLKRAILGALSPGGGLGGFGGGFANGGILGAGKWGIAGERGPELIRGPASVTPIRGGDMGAPVININVSGARGNAEIREMVAQGVGQGLSQYDRTKQREQLRAA